MEKIPLAELTGQTNQHLTELGSTGMLVHQGLAEPLQQLINQAAEDGIDLKVASSFRPFDRQLTIWNTKVSGNRPLLDDQGSAIDSDQLTDTEKLWAILRWSALPGASRHHWGTDIDIWDAAQVPADYQLKLIPEEYQHNGPFFKLNQWLKQNLAARSDFFRPYDNDKGGVAPEPWHLSFNPIAQQYQQSLNSNDLAAIIEDSDILLKQTILDNMEEIFARFILC